MPTPKLTPITILGILISVTLIGGHLMIEPLLSMPTKQWLLGENGPHETAEFLILMAGAGVAIATLAIMNRRADPLLTAWIVLALLCCIYVGGEEVSWGQWFFHWSTPADWANINDQGETNLHNTSAWLDQKPRLLLEVAVYFGGIILPLIKRYRPALLPARFALFYPSAELMPLAAGVLATKLIQTGFHPFYRSSEMQELLLFSFVLFYLLTLRARIRARDHGDNQ